MRSVLLLGGLFVLVCLSGCATLTKSADENNAAIARAQEIESREMADDWNMIWMQERPSRLSRWVVR